MRYKRKKDTSLLVNSLPFLGFFCVGRRRLPGRSGCQQGSVQSSLGSLSFRTQWREAGVWKEDSCLDVPCLPPMSGPSALTTSALILKGLTSWIVGVNSILGGISGCVCVGGCRKGQLCNDQKLMQTHNEWEACLPLLHHDCSLGPEHTAHVLPFNRH